MKSTVKKQSKHLLINQNFRETEAFFDKEIAKDFKELNLDLDKLKVLHHGSFLGQKNVKALTKFKAITMIVATFSNSPKIYLAYSACDFEDNFSRLEGRFLAKRRLSYNLKKSLPVNVLDVVGNVVSTEQSTNAMLEYVVSEKAPQGFVPKISQIANWLVSNIIEKKKESVELVSTDPYENISTADILDTTLLYLTKKHNLKAKTLKCVSLPIRKYSSKVFSGLNGTPKWVKDHKEDGYTLIEKGGHLVYAIIGEDAESSKKIIFVTHSVCHSADTFSNKLGCRVALLNFIVGKYMSYNYDEENVDDLMEALIKITEKTFKIAINLDVSK